MKAVNVDEVLAILHKYGKYIFVTDEKKYSSMVDEIANLKAFELEQLKQIKDICNNAGDLCDGCPFRMAEPCVCILDLPPCDWDVGKIKEVLNAISETT